MGRGSTDTYCPNSAPDHNAPDFLHDSVGPRKYNIGVVGQSGCGKSSLLNEILGADLAESGSTETTQEPKGYPLRLDDPRGHFRKFTQQLPGIHQDCVSEKLRAVTVWDLPGCGTRLHPSENYVKDKGLQWFDFVVLLVGDRILQSDCVFIRNLVQHKVKSFVLRSKLDLVVSSCILKEQRRTGCRLPDGEKQLLAIAEMDSVRELMVAEIQHEVPTFDGNLYMAFAPTCVEDGPTFEITSSLNELQLAVDRLFLETILDRHNHDLSKFFDRSLYGQASRIVFSWFACVHGHDRASVQVQTGPDCLGTSGTSDDVPEILPGDSASQIFMTMNELDNSESNVCSQISRGSQHSTTSWILVGATPSRSRWNSFCPARLSYAEPRCFLPETLFELQSGLRVQASSLQIGSKVMAADGERPLEVIRTKRHEVSSLIELHTEDGFLKVSPSHNVMIPSGYARAENLHSGDPVCCSGGQVQALVATRRLQEPAQVLEICFHPNAAVAVFSVPQCMILSRGQTYKHNARRAGMNLRGRNSPNPELESLPATDDGF